MCVFTYIYKYDGSVPFLNYSSTFFKVILLLIIEIWVVYPISFSKGPGFLLDWRAIKSTNWCRIHNLSMIHIHLLPSKFADWLLIDMHVFSHQKQQIFPTNKTDKPDVSDRSIRDFMATQVDQSNRAVDQFQWETLTYFALKKTSSKNHSSNGGT